MDILTLNFPYVPMVLLGFMVVPKIAGDCKVGSQVTSIPYSDSIVNHTIVGPVMSSITAIDERECEMECHLAVPDLCYMFNYHPSSKVCELLYKDRAAEYKVKKKAGSTFKTRKCKSNPCPPGEHCFSLGDQNNNSCVFIGHVMKANTTPVCIGAKGDSYGTFFAPADGKIKTFKLVHVSGAVCRSKDNCRPGKWGSLSSDGSPSYVELFITDNHNSKITPPHGYKLRRSLTRYDLPGFDNMSPELVFPEISPPLVVTKGKEFRIWFGQDLVDVSEDNNIGTTCAEVRLYYSK